MVSRVRLEEKYSRVYKQRPFSIGGYIKERKLREKLLDEKVFHSSEKTFI